MKKLMIIASSAFLMSIGVANAQVEDQETQTPTTQYQEGVESSEMDQDTLQQSDEFNQDSEVVTPDATTPDATTPDATTPLPEEDQAISPEDQSTDYSDDADAIRKEEETSVEETEESVED
jgi:hypothetical protein